MNEETIDMKIDSGSITRMKSNPSARLLAQIISPPLIACGIRVRGRNAVMPPRSTDQNDLTLGEIAPARGTSNEPKIGIKMVRRVKVSAFMNK
jgi:hypothetical protein